MFEQNGGCLKGRHLVGDPVDVVTGANTYVKFDFELPGPLPLRWRRYYSSARNTVACPLGWGHSHELDHTIDRDLDGLIYVDPLGTVVEFPELNEDGEEAIASGFLLRRLAARLFEIEQSDGPTRVFKIPAAGPAQLVALRQDEHAIKLQRSVTGRLEWIIDSRGVRTRVATDHAGRVTGLYLNEDADQRRELPLMLYRYDEAGNLVQARDGHGATLRFQYDQNNRMTRCINRLGHSFHFEYDSEGRCVHTFGDDGLFEVFLEYYPTQKCTIVRHADGGVWTYYYNDIGSLTEIRARTAAPRGSTSTSPAASSRRWTRTGTSPSCSTMAWGGTVCWWIPLATSTRPPRGSPIATIRRNTRFPRRRWNGNSATYSIPPRSARGRRGSHRSIIFSSPVTATATETARAMATNRASAASSISTGT